MENEEVLMENVKPEDLPTEAEQQEKVFVPSAPWKRALAWVLFGIVIVGLATWLMNIANPGWIESVKAWFGA